jgi:hypothetical protein
MNWSDYRRLRDDIAQHGQQTPIVVYEGMVLEGRGRLRACRELGIEPNFVRLTREDIRNDPEAYVRSDNLCRRQSATRRRSRPAIVVIQLPDL